MTSTDLNQIFEPLIYSWTQQTNSGSRYWGPIASSSDGTNLVAGIYYIHNNGSGYIYTSSDSGVNWTEQTNAGSQQWISIASSSDGKYLAACTFPGSIYTSADSGVTWTEQTNAGSTYWYHIASSSDGSKLAATVNVVNDDGYIYTNILASPTGYAVDGIDLNQIFQPLSSTSTTSPTGYTVDGIDLNQIFEPLSSTSTAIVTGYTVTI